MPCPPCVWQPRQGSDDHDVLVRVYVGVTDREWYQFLSSRPDLTEVNFWRPGGGRAFRVSKIGEPFAFKTHAPHNRIVGLGFYSGFVAMRLGEAWDLFGEANGAGSVEQMRLRIGQYRRRPVSVDEDPVIGCVMLRDTRFLPGHLGLPAPAGWGQGIVQGKSYDVSDSVIEGLLRDAILATTEAPDVVAGDVFGDPRLVPTRVGQRPFQALVLDAYHRRCAVTGERIVPASAGSAHPTCRRRRGEPRGQRGAPAV